MRVMVVVCVALGWAAVANGQETPKPQPPQVVATDGKTGHLLQAARHLEAAGHVAEAKRIRREVAQQQAERQPGQVAPPSQAKTPAAATNEAQQILVRLRLVELSRSKLQRLGFDFAKLCPSLDGVTVRSGNASDGPTFGLANDTAFVQSVLDALCKDKLAQTLAEPVMVGVSGRPMYFRSGGEIPVPVNRPDGSRAVEYRHYGTQLDLIAILLGPDKIRLELRPRISELDPMHCIQIDGQRIPGIRTREMETAVELRPGQTFVLAGMVQNRPTCAKPEPGKDGDNPKPPAGDEKDTQTEQYELLMVLSTEIVEPMAEGPNTASLRSNTR